jgi:hypothetical protein
VKRAVGLLVMTCINEELTAILQRRGGYNLEKMAPESYPGCLQVTCHGGVEDTESFGVALKREAVEELGPVFSEACFQNYFGGKVVNEISDGKKEIVTFVVIVPIELVHTIRLGPDSGGLVYVTTDMVKDIIEVSDHMRTLGPLASNIMAMFPDAIEAVENAFEAFRNKP